MLRHILHYFYANKSLFSQATKFVVVLAMMQNIQNNLFPSDHAHKELSIFQRPNDWDDYKGKDGVGKLPYLKKGDLCTVWQNGGQNI